MWSEWKFKGLPSLGDYIQIHAEEKNTGETATHEGFVTAILGCAITLNTVPPPDNWRALKWRLWTPPESEKTSTQRVLEEQGA